MNLKVVIIETVRKYFTSILAHWVDCVIRLSMHRSFNFTINFSLGEELRHIRVISEDHESNDAENTALIISFSHLTDAFIRSELQMMTTEAINCIKITQTDPKLKAKAL